MKKTDIRTIAVLSLLVALNVVLARFLSINAWNVRIGFSFLTVVLAAMLFGPVPAGIVAALADFIGAILFPTGAYFPGFTFTAFVTGIIYGLFLYKKQTPVRCVLAVISCQIVCTLLLNSLWISILYGSPFKQLLLTRIIQSAVLTPVQIIVILLLAKALPRIASAAGINKV